MPARFALLSLLTIGFLQAGPVVFDFLSYDSPNPAVVEMTAGGRIGGVIPIGVLMLELESVTPETALILRTWTAVGGIGPEPFLEVAGIGPEPFADFIMIVPRLNVDPFGGGSPLLGAPFSHPPTRRQQIFRWFFDIRVAEGTARQRLRFEIFGAQPLTFANPTAKLGSIDMSFQLVKAAGAAFLDAPLFTMTFSGDFEPVPEPATFPALAACLIAVAVARRRGPTTRFPKSCQATDGIL